MKNHLHKMNRGIIALLVVTTILYSCSASEDIKPNVVLENDEMNLNFSQSLGKTNEETLEILSTLFISNPAIKEAILKVGYEDEAISFRSLFDPTSSEFERNSFELSSFKEEFKKSAAVVSSLRGGSSNSMDVNEIIQNLIDGNEELYMPYIDESTINDDSFTIIASSEENQGNEAYGYKFETLHNNSRGVLTSERVLVDDDYAANYQTIIIAPIDGGGGGYGGGNGSGSGSSGGNTPDENYDNLLRMHVQIGAMRCNNQYDALVSFTGNGGGSEFKFFRANGRFVGNTENLTAVYNQVQGELSRKEIRKNIAVRQYVNWDYQWLEEQSLQGFAIYEWDNTDNEVKLKGNVGATKTVSAEVDGVTAEVKREFTTGFETTYSSDHDVLEIQEFNREYFYSDIKNNVNYGHGFWTDPVTGKKQAWRKAGSLYYTFHANMYYTN